MKLMSVSELGVNLELVLNECADTGETILVELPDQRLLTIQPLAPSDDDDLVDDLFATNPSFRAMVEKSKAGKRKTILSRQ